MTCNDAKRQRIDERTQPPADEAAALGVAEMGDGEQAAEVGKSGQDRDPTGDHFDVPSLIGAPVVAGDDPSLPALLPLAEKDGFFYR